MKTLLLKLWEWLKSIITKDETKSALIKILVEEYEDDKLAIIKDRDLGRKAIQLVRNLNKNPNLTGREKADIFNAKLLKYARAVGKVLSTAALNVLRELAVTAVKVAITNVAASVLLAKEVPDEDSDKEKKNE